MAEVFSSIQLPPVSERFYRELIKIYPPISLHRLKRIKSLEELNLIIGQQEVMQKISSVVVKDIDILQQTPVSKSKSLIQSIKDLKWVKKLWQLVT